MASPWDPDTDEDDIRSGRSVQTSREDRQPKGRLKTRSQKGAKEGDDPQERIEELIPPGGGGDGDYEYAHMLSSILQMMSPRMMQSNMYPPSAHPEELGAMLAPQMPFAMGDMITGRGGMEPTGYPDSARPVKTTRERRR